MEDKSDRATLQKPKPLAILKTTRTAQDGCTMLNKSAFMALFQRGACAECYKEARRYGRISVDSEWNIKGGPLQGAHRLITVNHHGSSILYHLHNGEVVSMQLTN